MKKSTILSVLHDDLNIHERLFVPLKQSKTKQAADKVYEKLEKVLPQELFDLLEDFIEKDSEVQYEEIERYFLEGFKIGLRIGVECMDE